MATRTIAIVDDQPSFRKTIKEVLSMMGDIKIVAEAENGTEYLKLLDNVKPDITFMDIQMPDMDGVEATKKALKKHPDLTIIGLSLYANEEYVNKLIKAGAKGYLLKLSNNYNIFKALIKNPKSETFFSDRIQKQLNSKNAPSQKTILVVDDFETNTIVIENSLKSAGYAVLKAKTASEGIRHAFNKKNKIDLIISDYNMPGKTGAQMISDIRKIPGYNNLPALILSSDNDEEKKKLAKKAGATGWLKKPFILTKFLTIVDSVF